MLNRRLVLSIAAALLMAAPAAAMPYQGLTPGKSNVSELADGAKKQMGKLGMFHRAFGDEATVFGKRFGMNSYVTMNNQYTNVLFDNRGVIQELRTYNEKDDYGRLEVLDSEPFKREKKLFVKEFQEAGVYKIAYFFTSYNILVLTQSTNPSIPVEYISHYNPSLGRFLPRGVRQTTAQAEYQQILSDAE